MWSVWCEKYVIVLFEKICVFDLLGKEGFCVYLFVEGDIYNMIFSLERVSVFQLIHFLTSETLNCLEKVLTNFFWNENCIIEQSKHLQGANPIQLKA